MKAIWFALALVSVPASALAQTPAPITSYILKFYQQGAAQPTQQESFSASAVQCGQAALPSNLPTTNPTRASWADPNSTTGQVCIYNEPTNGPLFSLAIGFNYEATLTASNDAGSSQESARAPFSRASVPPTPTAFRLFR